MSEQPSAPTPPSLIPFEVLQTLAVRWLESFTTAARAENRMGIMRLFSESSLICGSQKGGPLDRVISKNFEFDSDAARMIPHPPCILVVCPWRSPCEVVGGPNRLGDATLFLGVEPMDEGKQRFICYHAHFSLQ